MLEVTFYMELEIHFPQFLAAYSEAQESDLGLTYSQLLLLRAACLGNSFLDYVIEPYFEGMIIAVFTAAKNLQNRILLVIMFDQFPGGVRIVGKIL